MSLNKKNAGFTLIELMIVIAIIIVLATIAYPAYLKQGMRAKRSEARAALVALQLAQEKYRTNCPQYADTIVGTRGCAAGGYILGMASAASEHNYYDLAISNVTATTYTITATPTATGAQAGDTDCPSLTINQDGVKAPEACWK